MKSFFELNIGSTDDIAPVWGSSSWELTLLWRKGEVNKIRQLKGDRKLRETDLSQSYTEDKYQELCKLKYQLHEMNNKKVEYSLFRWKLIFWGWGKTGKILARQVKRKDSSSLISAIKQCDNLVTLATEINNFLTVLWKTIYINNIL